MTRTTDVLIVGAGPAGLFLACELARKRIRCAIVDKAPAPSPHSRALAIMPRTLELFERAGLSDPFLQAVHRVRALRFVTARRSALLAFDRTAMRYPFVSILPQWKTEAVLRGRLQSYGITVQYGHALTGIRAVDGGVECTIASQTSPYHLAASYIAGCDGVYSTVRALSGIAFPGRAYAQRALLADVPVRTILPADEACISLASGDAATLFPITESLRRIVVISARRQLPENASRQWLQHCVDGVRLPVEIVTQPAWSSSFTVQRRVAQRMWAGRAVLAGDAAHAHSPVGGQGMNTGLEDAWYLSQAIEAAIREGDHVRAFGLYESQRLPVARGVVRKTDALLHALASPNPIVRFARDVLTPYIVGIPGVQRRAIRSLLTA